MLHSGRPRRPAADPAGGIALEPTTAADLVPDHRELDDLFERLDSALRERAASPALELADLVWARLAVHIRAEHLVMFTALRSAGPAKGLPPAAEVERALTRLREDHDMFMVELAAAVNALKGHRSQAGDAPLPPELAESVGEHVRCVTGVLRSHNVLEEEHVYHWLDRVLAPAEREAVRQEMLRHLRNLPPRFGTASSGT